MSNLFDRSVQQEFTWESKHIYFFLTLNNIGPVTLEKIIEVNPDIDQWDKDYVASQFPNYGKMMHLLPNEIPDLQNLNTEEVVNFKEKNFPSKLLRMKINKPLILWYKGNLNIGDSVAVVGSRNMIPETEMVVEKFVKQACRHNFTIVSGLANGVDEKAHISTLENSGKTVAVLPSSLDNILPISNRGLAKEIVTNNGLLLTEYPPGSPKNPEKSNYTARNRIQAGISDMVFIAQSGIPGGTMVTANHAIDNEKKLIVYSSNNNYEEYAGNRYLTNTFTNTFNFSKMKLNKQQIEMLMNKQRFADYVIHENINFEKINLNSFL